MLGRLLVLGFLAFLGLAPAAGAHFESGLYSHRRSDCASRSDPITVVFYAHATAARTLNHLRAHTGWGGDTSSAQHFASHGICGAAHGEAYSGFFTRYHVRLRRTYHADDVWGTTTVGTPHHEDWVSSCGHAVDKGGVSQPWPFNRSGFDMGRKRVFDALYGQPGHTFARSENWGNTQEFRQCDGDYAGSNGTVFWFRMPASEH